ncbi:hypothetical protein QO003_002393 [Arthrobacter silviterrae]|nr:hypothetical protein [Arthrobacter silviterrae]MDQ0278090.1 hypothetical protein [Arthrobacter silviterrae]
MLILAGTRALNRDPAPAPPPLVPLPVFPLLVPLPVIPVVSALPVPLPSLLALPLLALPSLLPPALPSLVPPVLPSLLPPVFPVVVVPQPLVQLQSQLVQVPAGWRRAWWRRSVRASARYSFRDRAARPVGVVPPLGSPASWAARAQASTLWYTDSAGTAGRTMMSSAIASGRGRRNTPRPFRARSCRTVRDSGLCFSASIRTRRVRMLGGVREAFFKNRGSIRGSTVSGTLSRPRWMAWMRTRSNKPARNSAYVPGRCPSSRSASCRRCSAAPCGIAATAMTSPAAHIDLPGPPSASPAQASSATGGRREANTARARASTAWAKDASRVAAWTMSNTSLSPTDSGSSPANASATTTGDHPASAANNPATTPGREPASGTGREPGTPPVPGTGREPGRPTGRAPGPVAPRLPDSGPDSPPGCAFVPVPGCAFVPVPGWRVLRRCSSQSEDTRSSNTPKSLRRRGRGANTRSGTESRTAANHPARTPATSPPAPSETGAGAVSDSGSSAGTGAPPWKEMFGLAARAASSAAVASRTRREPPEPPPTGAPPPGAR